jgi:hypothetical protein
LLARLINFMDGVAGLQGWRWIFILEVSLDETLISGTC